MDNKPESSFLGKTGRLCEEDNTAKISGKSYAIPFSFDLPEDVEGFFLAVIQAYAHVGFHNNVSISYKLRDAVYVVGYRDGAIYGAGTDV